MSGTTKPRYQEWDDSKLKGQMADKDFLLLDVHIPFQGRIPRTDLEIPYDRIEQNLAKLPKEKDRRIVVYCISGRMSEIAANTLVAQGYTNVVNLKGGMLAWQGLGGQLEGQ